MKKFLLIGLSILTSASVYGAAATGRGGIDTTHVDQTAPFDGDPYDVGDTIGGYVVNSVTQVTDSSEFPLLIGQSGTSQSGWDVWEFTANITIQEDSGQNIEFTRDGSSNAPKHIIIDGKGFTLTVNTDSAMRAGVAIYPVIRIATGGNGSTTGGVTDSVIIKNLNIVHNLNMVEGGGGGTPLNPSHGRWAAVDFTDVNWIDFINVDIEINKAVTTDEKRYSVGGLAFTTGDQSAGSNWGAWEILWENCDIWVHSEAFYRRDQEWASGWRLTRIHHIDSMQSLFSFEPAQHWTLRNNVIHKTPHFGWFMIGKPYFVGNTCSTLARNDYYEYFDTTKGGSNHQSMTSRALDTVYTFPDAGFPGDGDWPVLDSGWSYGASGKSTSTGWNQFWSSSNSYALVLSDGVASTYGLDPGAVICSSTFVPGVMSGSNAYQGNRGIDIEHPHGTAADPILIFGNTLKQSQGRNADFLTGIGWNIRGRWGGRHWHFYNNTLVGIIDNRPDSTSLPWDSIPSSAGNRMYGINVDCNSEESSGIMDSFKVYNNDIDVEWHNDAVLGRPTHYSQNAEHIGIQINVPSNHGDPASIEVYGNHITTTSLGLNLGGTGPLKSNIANNGGFGFVWHDDTVARSSPYDTADFWSWSTGWSAYPDTGLHLRDTYYSGGADDLDGFQLTNTTLKHLWLDKTIRVVTVGTGTPPNVGVTGAKVQGVNAQGDTITVLTTGDTAVVIDTVNYYFFGNQGSVIDTNRGPWEFFASSGTDTTTKITNWNIRSDTSRLILTFSSVAGTEDTSGWRSFGGSPPPAAASGPRAKFRK